MTTGITIEISGKEKNKFTRFWNEYRHHPPAHEGGHPRTEVIEHKERLKQKNHFMDVKQRLAACNGLAPGAHAVGFSFVLPTGLPSSFFFKNEHIREKPNAKAKYHIKVKLEGTDVKAKQVLMIREPAVKLREGEAQSEKSDISTCCCIPQGTSTLKTDFEKNIYCPNEVARAIMHIDNSDCKVDVTQITFAVEQRIVIHIKGHNHTTVRNLVTHTQKGPKSGEKMEAPMELDLSKIRNEVSKEHMKKGAVKAYSKEDLFMMEGVQPASHSSVCTNEYFLTTKTAFDVCCNCCDNLPDGMLPLTIVPLVNPECFGFQPPGGWAPMDYGTFPVEVHRKDHVEVDAKHEIIGHHWR